MGTISYQDIARRVGACFDSAVPWKGIVYRSATPEYSNQFDLLSGGGSALHGGRWNPLGIATVYGSESPETAMAEALEHCRYYGVPMWAAMPRHFEAIEIRFRRMLDLTNGRVRNRLRISLRAMLTCDWRNENVDCKPITQQLGRACFECGFEGMIVPSAAEMGGFNLVWFSANMRRGGRFKLMRPDN